MFKRKTITGTLRHGTEIDIILSKLLLQEVLIESRPAQITAFRTS